MSVIALDIGTSRMKALLAHWDGPIAATASVRTPVRSEAPGEMAFPAQAVSAVAAALISGVAAEHPSDPVDTLVLSCLGTAMVPLDAAGRPLGPALSPADGRPPAVPGLMERVGLDAASLAHLTGSDPAVPSFLMHWLWWRACHPEVIRELARFRSLRGFLVEELCGADAEDPSWASRTMLYELEAGGWSEAIASAAGLPMEVLPAIAPAASVWPVRAAAGRRFGLAPDAVVVLGGMDNCCSVLGATEPGEARLVNIAGTYEHMAGTARLDVARSVARAAEALVHAYLLPGAFIGMSRVPIGHLLATVAEVSALRLEELLDGTPAQAADAPADLEGGAVRAALHAGTPPRVLFHRLLGSAAARLVRFLDAWERAGERAERIVVVGGGAARGNLLQLKADLLGRPVSTLSNDEAAGLGALRLAAMAVDGASPSGACALFANPVTRTWVPEASYDRAT